MANNKSKQPNEVLNLNQHPKVNKTFLDILDMITSLVNTDDDDPDNKVYTIDLSAAKEFYTADQAKNVLARIRTEGVKKIILCPYNFMPLGKEGGSVYIQAFRWPDEIKMDKLEVRLSDEYKILLNEHKSMVYYNPKETIAMKSKYARNIYLRLLKQMNRKKITFKPEGTLHGQQFTFYETVEQFRSKTGIPETYKLSNIKKTCQIITEEIASCTNYDAKVFYNLARQQGTKPVITHIAWTLEEKKLDIVEPDDFTVTEPGQNPDDFSTAEYQLSFKIIDITKLESGSAMSIAHNATLHGVSDDKVIDCCHYAMKQSVDNLGGYINAMVSRGGKAEPQANNPEPEQKKNRKSSRKNKFNDYPQRDYDFNELEKKLMNK